MSRTKANAPAALHPSASSMKTALVRAFLVGIVYQIILVPIQRAIEPAFTWAEVSVGVLLSFLVAESIVWGWTPTWREYRLVLACTVIAQGLPLIAYELVTHIVLGLG